MAKKYQKLVEDKEKFENQLSFSVTKLIESNELMGIKKMFEKEFIHRKAEVEKDFDVEKEIEVEVEVEIDCNGKQTHENEKVDLNKCNILNLFLVSCLMVPSWYL